MHAALLVELQVETGCFRMHSNQMFAFLGCDRAIPSHILQVLCSDAVNLDRNPAEGFPLLLTHELSALGGVSPRAAAWKALMSRPSMKVPSGIRMVKSHC